MTDTDHHNLQYSCDLPYCTSTTPLVNKMKLSNLLYILPVVQAVTYHLLEIYSPDYAKDTMKVEDMGKVMTRANQSGFACVSANLLMNRETCDLSPMFYDVAMLVIPTKETRSIKIGMPVYDLQVSCVLAARCD
jgi:hypothetical protein